MNDQLGNAAMQRRSQYAFAWSFVFVASWSSPSAAEEQYELSFSTYLGGSMWDHARDVCVDNRGNVYVVGGTASKDFPTTAGVYARKFTEGGNALGGHGNCDAFVAKLSPTGKLVWSTYLGGPNYDRAYAVEVDAKGYVYVAGRCGPGFPVTEGAFQTEYKGSGGGFYGTQNAFVAKLKPDGSGLVFSSYVGQGWGCRDLVIDSDGNVYLPIINSTNNTPPDWYEQAFANAFQKTPRGGSEVGVCKITSDGSRVLWATWLGGSGSEKGEISLALDPQNHVYIAMNTSSSDIPTTLGAHDRSHNGDWDAYVAKLQPDGSELIYGTYIGGKGKDFGCNTHNLAVDGAGHAYLSIWTNSKDFPSTPGVVDSTYNGAGDIAVVKLGLKGEMVACTFIGGSKADESEGISVDADGNVLVTGRTQSRDFPVTSTALRKTYGGDEFDGILVRLSSDLKTLHYATLIGGASYDFVRSCCLDQEGNLYIAGGGNGDGWPLRNAWQGEFRGTNDGRWGNGDAIIAKLQPTGSAGQAAADGHPKRRR
ncbi:MAG: SBBP repeat-containing protein [Planctomycetota bacterium]|nr:SBBP repeat-containing protein [Planctomycetota bacterium]